MAISQIQDSKPAAGPLSSKYKSQLTQRNKWDAKKKLVKKRLETLTHAIKNEESQNKSLPIICYQGKVDTNIFPHNCNSVSTSAMERAQELQENLVLEFPSFPKLMLRSHVSGGFWLGLPKKFCDLHLPKTDEFMVLVDENEKEYEAKYLVNKVGLSGGWRGFSLAHELLEGDALVFQLIEPLKFKIYIVRASGLSVTDGVIGLLSLNGIDKSTDAGEGERISETKKQHNQDPLALDIQKDKKPEVLVSGNEPPADQCDDGDSYSSGSQIVEGIRFSESVVSFKDVKDFKDFTICIDGLILDAELALHHRKKYYKLCRSQKIFLHENLINGLNVNLATGIISETVNIADAIRAINTTTSLNDLETWDKTLKAFEDLGMVVGFLRGWIGKMISLLREQQEIIEAKRNEKAEAEDEIRCLKEKLCNVEALVKRLDTEIDSAKVKQEGFNVIVRDIANLQW